MIRGIVLSLCASVLFAVMYYYTSLLHPLDGEQIFGWRMLLTLPMMTVVIVVWGEWRQVRSLAARLRAEPRLWLALPVSAALIGVQLWLFLWAPLHAYALDVSTGYFMLPLSMVLVGRLLYHEHLSHWRALAVLCAILGVGHELYRSGAFSWASLLVALGYPLYFVLRRRIGTDNLGGLWFDMLLMAPVAGFLAFADTDLVAVFNDNPRLLALIPILAVISTTAIAAYMLASHRLELGLFGLLGYVEPVLLVIVALLLGERIASQQWLTYVPIWFSVGLLATEGIIKLTLLKRADLNTRKRPRPPNDSPP